MAPSGAAVLQVCQNWYLNQCKPPTAPSTHAQAASIEASGTQTEQNSTAKLDTQSSEILSTAATYAITTVQSCLQATRLAGPVCREDVKAALIVALKQLDGGGDIRNVASSSTEQELREAERTGAHKVLRDFQAIWNKELPRLVEITTPATVDIFRRIFTQEEVHDNARRRLRRISGFDDVHALPWTSAVAQRSENLVVDDEDRTIWRFHDLSDVGTVTARVQPTSAQVTDDQCSGFASYGSCGRKRKTQCPFQFCATCCADRMIQESQAQACTVMEHVAAIERRVRFLERKRRSGQHFVAAYQLKKFCDDLTPSMVTQNLFLESCELNGQMIFIATLLIQDWFDTGGQDITAAHVRITVSPPEGWRVGISISSPVALDFTAMERRSAYLAQQWKGKAKFEALVVRCEPLILDKIASFLYPTPILNQNPGCRLALRFKWRFGFNDEEANLIRCRLVSASGHYCCVSCVCRRKQFRDVAHALQCPQRRVPYTGGVKGNEAWGYMVWKHIIVREAKKLPSVQKAEKELATISAALASQQEVSVQQWASFEALCRAARTDTENLVETLQKKPINATDADELFGISCPESFPITREAGTCGVQGRPLGLSFCGDLVSEHESRLVNNEQGVDFLFGKLAAEWPSEVPEKWTAIEPMPSEHQRVLVGRGAEARLARIWGMPPQVFEEVSHVLVLRLTEMQTRAAFYIAEHYEVGHAELHPNKNWLKKWKELVVESARFCGKKGFGKIVMALLFCHWGTRRDLVDTWKERLERLALYSMFNPFTPSGCLFEMLQHRELSVRDLVPGVICVLGRLVLEVVAHSTALFKHFCELPEGVTQPGHTSAGQRFMIPEMAADEWTPVAQCAFMRVRAAFCLLFWVHVVQSTTGCVNLPSHTYLHRGLFALIDDLKRANEHTNEGSYSIIQHIVGVEQSDYATRAASYERRAKPCKEEHGRKRKSGNADRVKSRAGSGGQPELWQAMASYIPLQLIFPGEMLKPGPYDGFSLALNSVFDLLAAEIENEHNRPWACSVASAAVIHRELDSDGTLDWIMLCPPQMAEAKRRELGQPFVRLVRERLSKEPPITASVGRSSLQILDNALDAQNPVEVFAMLMRLAATGKTEAYFREAQKKGAKDRHNPFLDYPKQACESTTLGVDQMLAKERQRLGQQTIEDMLGVRKPTPRAIKEFCRQVARSPLGERMEADHKTELDRITRLTAAKQVREAAYEVFALLELRQDLSSQWAKLNRDGSESEEE